MTTEGTPGGADARRTIIEEVRQIIAAVEEFTGLPSRWNGGLLVLTDSTGEAQTAQMLARVPYRAKKEWGCSITVVESVLQDDQRWRTLLHELSKGPARRSMGGRRVYVFNVAACGPAPGRWARGKTGTRKTLTRA